MVVLFYIHASSGREFLCSTSSPTLGMVGLFNWSHSNGCLGGGRSSVAPAAVLENGWFLMACDGQGRADLNTEEGG